MRLKPIKTVNELNGKFFILIQESCFVIGKYNCLTQMIHRYKTYIELSNTFMTYEQNSIRWQQTDIEPYVKKIFIISEKEFDLIYNIKNHYALKKIKRYIA